MTALTDDSAEVACVAERRTIETAMWAENNTGNTADTFGDYLSKSGPKYFSNSGSPTACLGSGVRRSTPAGAPDDDPGAMTPGQGSST